MKRKASPRTQPPPSLLRFPVETRRRYSLQLGSSKAGGTFAILKVAGGFTMIETVVVVAIITAISAQVLFGFTGFNEGAALNRSRRELALAIRRAQNMSLAVTQIMVGDPPTALVPIAMGLRLAIADPSASFLFADLTPRDNKYTGIGEKVLASDVRFERNVKINRILDESGILYPVVHILFSSPEAYLTFTDANGGALVANLITIELLTPSGQIKRVVVRANGQISMP